MSREMMYASREGPPPFRQPLVGPPAPHHPMSPPPSHPMPPSPSRIPFGGRQGSAGGCAPRERLASAPVRSTSPCPSAILERRDVKPDEDVAGAKSHTLSRGGEGMYADPYLLQEARLNMAATAAAVPHGPHPPGPGLDGPDHGLAGYHRASIRSSGSYGGPSPTDTMEHPSLYRQKSGRNSQLPTLGSKTPPPSPHRMTEVRMIDVHNIPPHGVPLERCSPVRQSFRKEETVAKPRNNMADSQGPNPNSPQTRERMMAMEQQIASLTGLVQHALLKGPNSSGAKEPPSERPLKTSSPAHSLHSAGSGGSPVLAARSSTMLGERSPAPLQVNLLHFRKNVADLRQQLQQMKQLQLQNQEALRGQMKRAEQEISVKLAEAIRCMEDPVQKQRALVDQDRHKYLGLEEHVLAQLSELEHYVESLKKQSPGPRRIVTLKDVEEGAVNLRKVGESLAGLKGEFPALQTRMRAVLRVEVEAVKFLKEEPHKLDSMLKRVKSLTDVLGCLRRCATEACSNTSSKLASVDSSTAVVAPPPAETPAPPAPLSPTAGPQSSGFRSEVMPSSLVVIHHVQSSPVLMQQSQQSEALQAQPSPPLTPGPNGHGVLPTSLKEAVTSDPPSPVRHKKAPPIPVNSPSQDLVIEELQSSRSKSKNRALSIEAAEKEWEEKRQYLGHYDGKEFERILQEAQANMMKGLSNLDVEGNPVATGDQTDNRSPTGSPIEPQAEWCPESPANPAETEKLAEKPAKATEKSTRAPLERSVKACVTGPASSDKVTKQGSEKANRSPPPPPPRKTYPSSSSGMTTTRSGEVVYTARKESASTVEGSEETPPLSPTEKPAKVPPETKPKSSTPPPVTSSVVREEEDEGDKIMAQLQAFQKCSVKDVGGKGLVERPSRIEPQIRELRPGALLPLKEKKRSSELSREDKEQDIDENGNTTVRQSPGVIYYVTGQISKDLPTPSEIEDTHEHREPTLVPSQVSNVNANDNSPSQQKQQQPLSMPPLSHPPLSPPPISPKPPGLNGFKLPRKQMKRSVSLKTSAEAEKGNIILNQINTEKKLKSIEKEQVSPSIIPTVKSTVSTIRDEPKIGVSHAEEAPCECNDQSGDKCESGNDEASLSPDLPGEEAPPPPDNIAFMITKTMVQALSCGEYQELVNAQKDGVQTVTVCKGGNRNNTTGNFLVDSPAVPDNGLNKKPVIIIFDEPMDIRSAYKRLSTVFECEEEMDRMLAEECIDEESEESDMDKSGGVHEVTPNVSGSLGSSLAPADRCSLSSSSSSSLSEVTEGGTNIESSGDAKQDGKKRFKFKFPKKQLAALTQAIRTGTKSGKKTLQVVVYEDEEESDGTLRQHKEAKRFEIVRNKASTDTPKDSITEKRDTSDSLCRTDKIRKSTYKTLDSLEQTIKQLETTISEMGPPPVEEPVCPVEANVGETNSSVTGGLRRSVSLPTSKGPATKVLPPSKSSLRKTKPQLLPRPVFVPTTITTTAPTVPSTIQQNASVASPTSRMPVPLSAKSRQSPGTTDKTGKQQKLQDAQRQFRQANGSAKRVGGDHKSSSPSVPVSKIPAFYPSSTKASAQFAPDATNSINPSNSSSSSSCSSSTTTKSSLPSPHAPRSSSAPNPSSHIPSLSNGSHKLPAPSQHSVKALSFSSQTQNGRAHSFSFSSSSSSTPSPLSPTPLGPGGKSIRTIHTPSFTSYRPHNGSAAKSCIPTATAAKDAA